MSNRAFKNLIWVVIATALLVPFAFGQTTSITVNVVPPAPAAFTVTVPPQQSTLSGVVYNVTGSLTFTPAAGGTVTPPPATGAITKVADTSGTAITTIPAGGTLVVSGSGFGSFGTATVAGLSASVVTWTPTAVTLRAPLAGAASGTAAGPVVLKPGDAATATSTVQVTITGLTATLPPVPGPTWESPVIWVSVQTLPDPPHLLQGDEPYTPHEEPDYEWGEPDPVIYAVMDDNNVPVPPPYSYAEPFTFVGDWLGDTPGEIKLNNSLMEVISWSPTAIKARSLLEGTTNGIGVEVMRADFHYYATGSLDGEIPYSTD